MKKLTYILITVCLLLLLLAGFIYMRIVSSPTKVAILSIEEGNVLIDRGQGWLRATDEIDLSINDKIKTEDNSIASLILYESAIISLEPNTEISIVDLAKKHIKLKQESGSTWNKLISLGGIEGLSIQTPTTVATVRGTAFEVNMDAILVGEGIVDVEFEGEKISVGKDEKVEFTGQGQFAKKQMIKSALTNADKEKLIKKMQRTVKMLQKIRELEIQKHRFIAGQLQKRYGIDEAKAREYLSRADLGEFDLEEIEKKSPIKMESAKKIKGITSEIIAQNQEIERTAKRKLSEIQEQQTK